MDVLAIALLVVLTGCAAGGEGSSDCGPTRGVVARVIDGDTIELETGERVRYLMVDAPEVSGGTPECFGPEARDFNRDLVEGREITLAYDAECQDRFGRLLAWVSVEGREVNPILVERGYACVLYIPPSGEARLTEFEDLELRARTEMRGMWGICQEAPCE